ncbi:hypothetical protein J2S19_005035 [Metabacillus malikii]|uniref:Uncharacterized protein n=1 Tax=Metabacillus malikii TaxID=1504265 RepID=A0ABT9ZN24_9BACI|nr:hypothetical protein [Metabacillus malikii]
MDSTQEIKTKINIDIYYTNDRDLVELDHLRRH